MSDFYCGRCGRFKAIALKVEREGKRPICSTCKDANEVSPKRKRGTENQRRYLVTSWRPK